MLGIHKQLFIPPCSEVLSMAGLAGAAPHETSMVPGWTWNPCYLSGEVSHGTSAAAAAQSPHPLPDPLCSPVLGCWDGCKVRCIFPCVSCSTQLMKTPQEVALPIDI